MLYCYECVVTGCTAENVPIVGESEEVEQVARCPPGIPADPGNHAGLDTARAAATGRAGSCSGHLAIRH